MNERMSEGYTNIPNKVLECLFAGYLDKPAIKYYIYLRTYRNRKSGKAWPSVKVTLQEMTISARDIKPARQQLIDVGLITVKNNGRGIEVEFNDEASLTMVTCFTHVGNDTVTHSELPTIKNTSMNYNYDITPTAASANASLYNSVNKEPEQSEGDAMFVVGSNNEASESLTVSEPHKDTWMVPLEELFN